MVKTGRRSGAWQSRRWVRVARGGLFSSALAIAGTACGGSDTAAETGRGFPGGTAGQPAGLGGAGGGVAAGTSGGGFGNTDASVPILGDAGAWDGAVVGDPDTPTCGGAEIEPMITMETIPGNVLLVFDRSGSMKDTFEATGNPKWQDARDAVTAAIAPLQDSVTVGALFFPDPPSCGGDSCCVPAFGTGPQIGFMPGADFLAAWDTFWSTAPEPNGGTPTAEALEAANLALTTSLLALTGTTAVVLVTDGDPTCSLQGSWFNPIDVATKVATLAVQPAAWLLQSVQTHVVGLPGADSDGAVTVLDGVAMAGGTAQHVSAADPTTFQSELAKIIGASVTTSFDSCMIGLPNEPPNPDDVALVVVESGTRQAVARDLGAGGGWLITPDGLSIVLQGELCNQAREGAYDKISVVFGCVDLPPLVPPVPD